MSVRTKGRRRCANLREMAKYRGQHLFVLVHGYQGTHWDMRAFRNQLALAFPDALLLNSTANENKTEDDIGAMGARLAREVVSFITEQCPQGLGRLSFVAHSLGGIIVRSALTHELMAGFLRHCYTFVTLATPHCGSIYTDSVLHSTGLWFLKKWNKSTSLSQLSMSDASDPSSCFLARLSQQKGLEHFANVFLVASQQDKYVPFASARLELCKEAIQDKKKGAVYQSMLQNLLRPLASAPNLELRRFDVSFVANRRRASQLDAFIGRAAHIFFLDDQLYMKMLLTVYRDYFL